LLLAGVGAAIYLAGAAGQTEEPTPPATPPPSKSSLARTEASRNDKEIRRPVPAREAPQPEKPASVKSTPQDAPPQREEEQKPPDRLTAQMLERINGFRRTAGVPPLGVDLDLCRGCAAHAAYLAKNCNEAILRRWNVNDEDRKLPGYTEEGREAARHSLVAVNPSAPFAPLDQWMATFLFRLGLLESELRRIGFGHARHPVLGLVLVLDVTRGRGLKRVLLYPLPGQDNVPPAYPGNEIPDPIPEAPVKRAGFPITATFPPFTPVRRLTARLTGAAGNELAVWLSSSENPAFKPGYQRNSVCVIGKEPLKRGATYTVRLAAEVFGKAWERTWGFTTAEREPPPRAEGEAAALRALNDYRKLAGLAPVTLDPALSRPCRLHAEYLVKNFGKPTVKGLGVHDEIPGLPGFTPEGRRAARGAVIHLAGNSADAVDSWVNSFFHRIPLLSPDLRRVGFGLAKGDAVGSCTVVDVDNGKGDDRVILYPAEGQKKVPLAYQPGEKLSPMPKDADRRAGYPVTVTFPRGAAVRGVTARLAANGKEVPVWLTTPDKPLHPLLQRNSACILARAPLKPETTYTVSVKARIAGKPWERKWSFMTGR
jgi:uncharacterized protein YkwD